MVWTELQTPSDLMMMVWMMIIDDDDDSDNDDDSCLSWTVLWWTSLWIKASAKWIEVSWAIAVTGIVTDLQISNFPINNIR